MSKQNEIIMAIRLVNGCVNCANLSAEHNCTVHQTKVEEKYTCDSFDMRASLENELDCLDCSRHQTNSCPHPSKAGEDMLCTKFAPMASA